MILAAPSRRKKTLVRRLSSESVLSGMSLSLSSFKTCSF